MSEQTVKPGRYRHHKGGECEVIGTAHGTEYPDGCGWVIYRGEDGRLWMRIPDDFLQTVFVRGEGMVPRFRRLDG